MSLESIKEIVFHVQDVEYRVKSDEITPQTTLNSYIRNYLNLKGTKYMCLEGGCGVCVVVVKGKNPTTQEISTMAVNSCLVPILLCHGWRVYTIEGIGNSLTTFHPIQKVLAKFNGTQCGFCSPAMVMNMYALTETKKSNLTMEDVENSFGGHICRCTGYRPILSAFKSLCKDADPKLLGECPDIEDLKLSCYSKERIFTQSYNLLYNTKGFTLSSGNSKWIKVTTLKDLLKAIQLNQNKNYMLICGNTAQGVYEDYKKTFDVYIDVKDVEELTTYKTNKDSIVLGANITLSNTMDILNKLSENSKFSYLKKVVQHIDLVANVGVRNLGSLAGNLMIKHDHNEFPSDIFLILETIGSEFTIVDIDNHTETMAPHKFIKTNMKQKVLKSIKIPSLDSDSMYESYKIMQRAQNVHAIVNAGFLLKQKNEKIHSAVIVYGHINSTFIHAEQSEKFLIGKKLFDNTTIKDTCDMLNKELNCTNIPPDPTPEMRKQLAIALFYKFILSITPDDKRSPKHKSGATKLYRPISSGVQDYETTKSLYPLTEAIPKLEAMAQTSGEAEYVMDMPDVPHQLFAAFVLANAPTYSIIKKIDPSKALKIPEIIAFYSKDDIPGDNNFTPQEVLPFPEEIFCSGRVIHYYQPVGILVGTNDEIVNNSVDLVKITFEYSKDKPIIGPREIIKENKKDKIVEEMTVTPKRKGNDIKHIIKGSLDISEQYHFHMETQACNVIPNENGLDVYPTTQWMDLEQIAISKMLKIPNNLILIHVRRCGGAFGAKISRNSQIACATALAAWKLKKPVKFIMPLKTNMKVVGKRWPLSADYEVGVDDKGIIQYLEMSAYSDAGAAANDNAIFELVNLFVDTYDSDTFLMHMNSTRSDTYTNTWTRAPGSTEGAALIETIMEHISYEINIDPVDLRKANLKKDNPIKKYLDDLYEWADITKRKEDIKKFNEDNRWKKRGIAVVPITYDLSYIGPYPVLVSIYHGDGSVTLSHGGIEIGQGINTKAAQTCAYKLGIPLEKVHVLPSHSFIASNATATGGSITSEAVCYGVEIACETLLRRLEPYKEKETWENTINKAFRDSVSLSAIAQFDPKSPGVKKYLIYGVCATEVLLDVLTGQYLINRVDIIEDTGRSINPNIDVGQIEGAFVMGLGYQTTEKIVYDDDGKILTINTWTYTPPIAKDIPIDFRVKFPKNNDNPVGILKSKATAEPPLCLTIAVPLAIRNAVASARIDSDKSNSAWYPINGPSNVENVFMNCSHNYNDYKL